MLGVIRLKDKALIAVKRELLHILLRHPAEAGNDMSAFCQLTEIQIGAGKIFHFDRCAAVIRDLLSGRSELLPDIPQPFRNALCLGEDRFRCEFTGQRLPLRVDLRTAKVEFHQRTQRCGIGILRMGCAAVLPAAEQLCGIFDMECPALQTGDDRLIQTRCCACDTDKLQLFD